MVKHRLRRADIVKCFRPLKSILAANLSVRGYPPEMLGVVIENKLLDVLVIRSVVVVAKDRKTQFLGGKPRSKASTAFTRWSLRLVGEIGFHFPLDPRCDVGEAVDTLRTSRKIVFFPDTVRLQSTREVFRIIFRHSRHPASRLHNLSGHVMVWILFVGSPRIIADYGIDFQQANQVDQALAHFLPRYAIHLMIAVFEIDHL